MKPRKWVLVFCSIIIAGGVAMYEGIRALEESGQVQKILIQTISPAIGGKLTVDKVHFGFFSVYLQNVKVSLPLNAFTVDIKDIKAGISLRKLIATRGNFGKSINKIIFVNPRITVVLREKSIPRSEPSTAPAFTLPSSLPLDYLLIQNGTVWVAAGKGYETQIGEELNGNLRDDPEGIVFTLKGKCASNRKNCTVSGVIAKADSANRLSLRLDKARITRPIHFPGWEIGKGTIDAVCEVSSVRSTGPAQVETDGWVRIAGGRIGISGQPQALENLSCVLTLGGSRVMCDSISADWNDIVCHGSARWDWSGKTPDTVALFAGNISIPKLFPKLPAAVNHALSGAGWLTLNAVRATDSADIVLRLAGGGVNLLGKGSGRLAAVVTVRNGQATIDSLSLRYPFFKLGASGFITMRDSLPLYEVSVDGAVDSLLSIVAFGGSCTFSGKISGIGPRPDIDGSIRTRRLKLGDLALGSYEFYIAERGDTLRFYNRVSDSTGLYLSGVIAGVSGNHPALFATIKTAPLFLQTVAPQIFPKEYGTVCLNSSVSGKLPLWECRTVVSVKNKLLNGDAIVVMTKDDTVHPGIAFKLFNKNLLCGGRPFPIRAGGSINKEFVKIDSLTMLEGLTAAGTIGYGKTEQTQLSAQFTVSLSRLNTWFLSGYLPLDSGTVYGHCRISGKTSCPSISAELHVRHGFTQGIGPIETDAVISSDGKRYVVLPLIVRKAGDIICSLDTLTNDHGISVSGEIEDVDIAPFVNDVFPDIAIKGKVSGKFASTDTGFPIIMNLHCPSLSFDTTHMDSIALRMALDPQKVVISEFSAKDGDRSKISGDARIPWSFLGEEVGEGDTLHASGAIAGDLLATIEKNISSPIGGTGRGQIAFSLTGTESGWYFEKLKATIPKGVLTLRPFVLSKISNFSFTMMVDDSSHVTTDIKGTINNRPIRIYSSHAVPQGYEPFVFGPLDFGVLLVETPKHGVDVHLPGFQEIGELVDVEFAAKPPFGAFALSGPIDRPRITGTWIIRSAEFTFPYLDTKEIPWEFDPFPYVNWEFDLKIGNRNVMYFWDLAGKRQKIMRFVEADLDPTSKLSVLGRDLDKTFRLAGSLRSYKGAAYFGTTFDRRFEVGMDFSPQLLSHGRGYDNMPVIWGSAETFSDSSRFDRVTLTLQTSDPLTGAVSQRGRIALIPSTTRLQKGKSTDSIPNFVFNLSSDVETVAGESEREFFKEAGLQFTSIGRASGAVSSFGEQYLQRYLLQRFERKIAKKLGLDVINIETSIASNYFNKLYDRQTSGGIVNQWNYLALANVGLTVGRYFFNDNVFLKARGELVPINDTLLTPEYSIGMEIQPLQFLVIDGNLGVRKGETSIEYDPNIDLELRLPITRLRKLFKF